MSIELLGFPTTLGLPRQAYLHGPESLRDAGLVNVLADLGATLIDMGDRSVPAGQRGDPVNDRLSKVVHAAREQAAHWLSAHVPGNLMLTIGGDHSTSLGTILALSQMYAEFDAVWVDAHGDFNVVETSPSGNPHGMVLSLATGLIPDQMEKLISPSALHLWGIRDLDPGERALLEREHVEILDPAQTRQAWTRLTERLKPNVFLSFDVDSVEPAEAPGTMTPVPAGFHAAEALELVEVIARERNLIALDIVEFHPDRDRDSITLRLALEVARRAVASMQSRTHK